MANLKPIRPKLISILFSGLFIFLWLVSERELAFASDDFLTMFNLFMGVCERGVYSEVPFRELGWEALAALKLHCSTDMTQFLYFITAIYVILFSILIWRSNDQIFPIFLVLFLIIFAKPFDYYHYAKQTIVFLGVTVFLEAYKLNRPKGQISRALSLSPPIIFAFLFHLPGGVQAMLLHFFDRPQKVYFSLAVTLVIVFLLFFSFFLFFPDETREIFVARFGFAIRSASVLDTVYLIPFLKSFIAIWFLLLMMVGVRETYTHIFLFILFLSTLSIWPIWGNGEVAWRLFAPYLNVTIPILLGKQMPLIFKSSFSFVKR